MPSARKAIAASTPPGACGTPLRALVEASVARGNHPGLSAGLIIADYEARLAGPGPSTAFARLTDGRSIAMSYQPLAGGGSVVTFEDVSERRRSEALIKEQNERLRQREEELAVQNGRFHTALENINQGVCFFDGDQRLIVCNRRYAELYGLDPGQTLPGTTVREIVERRAAVGTGPKGMTVEEYVGWRDAVAAGVTRSATTSTIPTAWMAVTMVTPSRASSIVSSITATTTGMRKMAQALRSLLRGEWRLIPPSAAGPATDRGRTSG